MRLTALRVRNFRCLADLDLPLDSLTAIIGANGTGKSSVIRALEFLFGQAAAGPDDVTAGAEDLELEVVGVFGDLDDGQAGVLGPWLDAGGLLVVGRRWTGTTGEDGRVSGADAWFATRTVVTAFLDARAPGSATQAKTAYAAVRALDGYADLPAYGNRDGMLAALDTWEAVHPDAERTTVEDGGPRFDKAGTPDLRAYVDLVVVPAVRDPTVDATEAKGSNLARLTDLVLHSQVDLSGDLESLRQRTAMEYDEIVRAGAAGALAGLQATVTSQLETLAPGTAVRLEWQGGGPTVGAPSVRASIVESGYAADVGRQGHGVQRAYVFALLRALVDARAAANEAADGGGAKGARSSLLLVIEEPELYQHPVRSQYLSRTLADLAQVGHSQVLYATHSPYFAGVERLDALRLFRMVLRPDGVSVTTFASFDVDAAVARLDTAAAGGGSPWTSARLRTQIGALLETPVGEGLFARAAVLVEGSEDRGVLRGADEHLGRDLAADGIAVVPVDGKGNLDRAYVLYEQLGVPTFLVFDADNQRANLQDRQRNATLTRLVGAAAEETPPTQVNEGWACADHSLMEVIAEEVGRTALAEALGRAADDLGLTPERAAKNGVATRRAVLALAEAGKTSATLAAVLGRVRGLVGATAAPAGGGPFV